VNFIGHAQVALWSRDEPAFVLGAMLPDLVGMAGLRVPGVNTSAPADAPVPCMSRELAEGVALHHRTDQLFHSEPHFLRLTQRVLDELTALGVPRGPARGVAHVGVELLLDGELLGEPGVARGYEQALGVLPRVRPLFAESPQIERWTAFSRRLAAYGTPYDYRNADAVVDRLVRVFAGRQRLALDSNSERIVRSVLPDLQRHVASETPLVLSELRRRLENVAPPTNDAVLVR
jgi:hypothetical protein